jgi:hypothetical protein
MTIVMVRVDAEALYDKHNRKTFYEGTTFPTSYDLARRYEDAGAATIVRKKSADEAWDDFIKGSVPATKGEVEDMEDKSMKMEYASREDTLESKLEEMTVDSLRAKAVAMDIDLDAIEGTGVNGNVLRGDLISAIKSVI